MTLKPWVLACLLGLSLTAGAQTFGSDALLDWKEAEVPPPPAFDAGKLLHFDVSPGSSLVFGVDPATLNVSRDGVVRYVMVATSPSGARNVFYEGLRCTTAEFKTYARYTDGAWRMVEKPEWRSLSSGAPSRHALEFARAGACDNAAPALSVHDIVRQLKAGRFNR